MILKTIEIIATASDIHIRKNPKRNLEYTEAFENLYKSLKEKKPHRIALVGDIFDNNLDLQGEQLIMAKKFLNSLAEIAPVRITRGNHDFSRKDHKRVDSVKAIIELIDNPNIIYYDKTGFYEDGNVIWAVWHHGERNNSPWVLKEAKDIELKRKDGYTIIDLFHESINGGKAMNGFEMKKSTYTKKDEFKGDFGFFGHIHLQQYLNSTNTRSYCGSLIQQDITEGDGNFHGYILWNVSKATSELIPIKTRWSFHNVPVSPYIDFDDLDFEIENITDFMTIRFLWQTLPQTRCKDNERKLSEYINKTYKNSKILHKNEFIVDDKIDVSEKITLENITTQSVQHEVFTEYFLKIGVDQTMIDDILKLDDEIFKLVDIDNSIGGEWDIIKFGGENFRSYGKFDIDWRDQDGVYQICGMNKIGKTSIYGLLQYVLYGKSLETEFRLEHGNKRFVNNRNGAKFTNGYIVIYGNGEYYGIKRRTDLSFAKDGSINGSPTVLNYYLLNNPDDDMDDNTNNIEILDEERKSSTQKKIDAIIGTYENFHRAVMTTSDTLNKILSNDMATFTDSLLFDSGLDVFDVKLKGLKVYTDKQNQLLRYTCNVEDVNKKNLTLNEEIKLNVDSIKDIETIKIPEIQDKLIKGRDYVEKLTKKLFKIDEDIYILNIEDTQEEIDGYKAENTEYSDRVVVLKESINPLCETYDSPRLDELIQKRDNHKGLVYDLKLEIKGHEQSIRNEEHKIEIIRGEIVNLSKDGAKKKDEIKKLTESKNCPTCGQKMTEEHQVHIAESIKLVEKEMFNVADEIKKRNIETIPAIEAIILTLKTKISDIGIKIDEMTTDMETVLVEIGTLNNLKNDVDKRKELQTELDNIPLKIQNNDLNVKILQKKIDDHANSLLQIIENENIEKGIKAAKEKIKTLEGEENDERTNLHQVKTQTEEKKQTVVNNNELLKKFKEQEYKDSVVSTYKKGIHRDGIPKTLLSNYIIPKINETLAELLAMATFKVYLDPNDLRPKLIHNNRPDAIVECIGSSGAERTFSSIPLKFALNQINIKTKPSVILLDEILGKLDDISSEDFNEMLLLIKNKVKKIVIVEHNRSIDPDYVIEVTQDDDGISSLNIN